MDNYGAANEYIGTIITDDTFSEVDQYSYLHSKVFKNSHEYIQFVLESQIFDDLEGERIDGFENGIKKNSELNEFLENFRDDYLREQKNLQKKLEDYYFLFKVEKNQNQDFLTATSLDIEKKVNDNDDLFIVMPFFNYQKEELFNKIKNGQDLGSYEIFRRQSKSPFESFIALLDNNKLLFYGPFNNNENRYHHLKIKEKKFKEIEIKDFKKEEIILGENTLFIKKGKVGEFIDNIEIYTEINVDDLPSNKLIEYESSESAIESYEDVIDKKVLGEKELEINNSEAKTNGLEIDFLNNLKAHTQNNNLFYNIDDLINFHIAMKSNDFVILAGKSGTGKSKLAQMYAETLGAHFKLIPVKPSWNDDSDLLGFYDNQTNIYQADENNFIDFLIESQNKPNEIFIVCLDEMNLARVEYYFSKFLSKLQTNERFIELFNKNLVSLNRVNPIIKIGENIKFVGTINLDETTFNLSDKVLDRADIVNLEILNFNTGWIQEDLEEKEIKINFKEFKSFLNHHEIDKVRVREFLWELNKILKEYNFEFGPRVLVSIENYLSNITTNFDEKRGLDYQLKQRVFTKLRGPEEAFKGLFEKILEVLNKYKELSSFEQSKVFLNSKKYELDTYGFTR